jgi:hypothetical protein
MTLLRQRIPNINQREASLERISRIWKIPKPSGIPKKIILPSMIRHVPGAHRFAATALRLAQGMLFSCFTPFTAHHFAKKTSFPHFLFEHFSDTRI